jgi:hypothetical protein
MLRQVVVAWSHTVQYGTDYIIGRRLCMLVFPEPQLICKSSLLADELRDGQRQLREVVRDPFPPAGNMELGKASKRKRSAV